MWVRTYILFYDFLPFFFVFWSLCIFIAEESHRVSLRFSLCVYGTSLWQTRVSISCYTLLFCSLQFFVFRNSFLYFLLNFIKKTWYIDSPSYCRIFLILSLLLQFFNFIFLYLVDKACLPTYEMILFNISFFCLAV